MSGENQKRAGYLLKTIQCYSQLREFASKAFRIQSFFPLDLSSFSQTILSNKKIETNELYQREIKWPLEEKFMGEILWEMKERGIHEDNKKLQNFAMNFRSFLDIFERRLRDYFYKVRKEEVELLKEIQFWKTETTNLKIKKQIKNNKHQHNIVVLNDEEGIKVPQQQINENNQTNISLAWTRSKQKTNSKRLKKSMITTQRTTLVHSYKTSQNINFDLNTCRPEIRKTQRKVLKNSIRKRNPTLQNEEKKVKTSIVIGVVSPPDIDNFDIQDEEGQFEMEKKDVVPRQFQRKRKERTFVRQRPPSYRQNFKRTYSQDVSIMKNNNFSFNRDSSKKQKKRKTSRKISKIYSKEEVRETNPKQYSKSKFYKKHMYKDVKKGERKKNNKKLIEQKEFSDIEKLFIQQQSQKKRRASRRSILKTGQMLKRNKNYRYFRKGSIMDTSSKNQKEIHNFLNRCKKSEANYTEENEINENLQEKGKIGIVSKQDVDLLKGDFESLLKDEKSIFFKQQEYIQQKENQFFQQHLKKMFVHENNFFKEPFTIQKSQYYFKNEKILQLERGYAFRLDDDWIKGKKKGDSIVQFTPTLQDQQI